MNIPLYPFACPFCKKELILSDKSYVCENKHLFDVSKSGYVNLLPVNKKNSVDPGDNKEMIQARVVVMDKGYYKSLSDRIIDLLTPYAPKSIIDAGCGIGYLTERLSLAFPSARILGADISKYAVSSASKRYKNIPFAVASSNSLPVESGSADAVVCAFAPVFNEEFKRVLKENGAFVRVIPAKRHLYNLKEKLYRYPAENESDPEEMEGFAFIKAVTVADTFEAQNNEELISLVQMTPYFYHAKKEFLDELAKIPNLSVSQEFEVRLYTRK